MRRTQRLIAGAVLIALSGLLTGCGGLGNFDPSDLLDFLDTKKKLPGERKPVFPEGVPGVETGVPKELYRGTAQQPDQGAIAANPPPPPPAAPKSKRASKSKGQPATAAAPDAAAPDAVPEEDGSAAAAPPDPKPKKIVRKRTTAPPPEQPAAQAAPAAQSGQQAASPFPAPVPSGTFSR
jgi:hypothetical protein